MSETGERLLVLPVHFEELLRKIEPPEDRRTVAADIPKDVRTFLANREDFATMSPYSRLTGSYRRHTAIHGIKDVDFLVFVRYEGEKPEAADVIDELRRVLDDLPRTLGYGGRAQTLRKQRRSVQVSFDDEDFHLDVVPALLSEGLHEQLLVPDREWKKWVGSHPLGYGEALSALNQEHGAKVVPLIKLFKHWRTAQMKYQRPKSYWLEALAYQHVSKGWVTTEGKLYAELFTELLGSVHENFSRRLQVGGVPQIPDPMLGHDIAFNWERSAFESFMRRLSESIGWAERALAKDKKDMGEAIALWQKVFGKEYFIDSPALRKRQEALWTSATGAYVSSYGGVSSGPNDKGLRVPGHRFYGEER